MSGIKDYSTTPSNNNTAPPNGFPEGMAPASLNDGMRQVMADIRSWYNSPLYRDLGNAPTYVSATSFTIAGDVTATYLVGSRILCYGTIMGTLYGTISVSSYSAPNTTITVVLDSGSLTSNLSAVSLGVPFTGKAIPAGAISGQVLYPDAGELTIASGAITVTSAGLYYTIDTEGDAATDDLVTINGGGDGQSLLIRTENSSRDVVIKTSGNIVSSLGEFTLSANTNPVQMIYDGLLSKWVVIAYPLPDQTSNSGKVLKTDGSAVSWGTTGFTSGAVIATTSGTTVNFTSIPSGISVIHISFAGVSTNGTSSLLLQLGDAGGVETSGYAGCATDTGSSINHTTGFYLTLVTAAAALFQGLVTLTLVDGSTNTWSVNGVVSRSDALGTNILSGSKSLTGTLDRLTITTVTGVNTFDAGKINIVYQ